MNRFVPSNLQILRFYLLFQNRSNQRTIKSSQSRKPAPTLKIPLIKELSRIPQAFLSILNVRITKQHKPL